MRGPTNYGSFNEHKLRVDSVPYQAMPQEEHKEPSKLDVFLGQLKQSIVTQNRLQWGKASLAIIPGLNLLYGYSLANHLEKKSQERRGNKSIQYELKIFRYAIKDSNLTDLPFKAFASLGKNAKDFPIREKGIMILEMMREVHVLNSVGLLSTPDQKKKLESAFQGALAGYNPKYITKDDIKNRGHRKVFDAELSNEVDKVFDIGDEDKAKLNQKRALVRSDPPGYSPVTELSRGIAEYGLTHSKDGEGRWNIQAKEETIEAVAAKIKPMLEKVFKPLGPNIDIIDWRVKGTFGQLLSDIRTDTKWYNPLVSSKIEFKGIDSDKFAEKFKAAGQKLIDSGSIRSHQEPPSPVIQVDHPPQASLRPSQTPASPRSVAMSGRQ